MDIIKYCEIQNKLNGRKHITDEYFPDLGEHLWKKFSVYYSYNMLDFYNYLDKDNRLNFKRMVLSEFGIIL